MVVRMENVGGAVVKRGFTSGSEYVKRGLNLTAEQVAAIPVVNRSALVSRGHLDLYPMPPNTMRHVISAGFGRYNVIEGRRLNEEPLTKEQATALAGALLAPIVEDPTQPQPAPIGEPPVAPPTPKQTRARARKKKPTVKSTPPRN